MNLGQKILLFSVILCISPVSLLAQVKFVHIFPNTEDDTNLEYVELVNTGCDSMDIGGYTLSDKVKTYTIPTSTRIDSQIVYRIVRPTSKIELNNTNESLTLSDQSGNIVHTFSYTSSTKGSVISVPDIVYDVCNGTDNTSQTGSGTSGGGADSGSGSAPPTGDTGTGNIVTPESGTGIVNPRNASSDSGAISSNSGGVSASGGVNNTGSIADTSTTDAGSNTGIIPTPSSLSGQTITNILGKSGSLDPQILIYDDSDHDGYIDTLEILYDVFLTGSIDIAQIQLYSNTGGLYNHRINTETGYILDYKIQNNILRLDIVPSDFQKTTLSVNNTTQSELRLKFTTPSLKSFSGGVLGDFLLTSSFDSYHTVYGSSEYQEILTQNKSGTGETTASGTTLVPVGFPEIIPTIQNYTNTTLSGESFICRETPCRLNMNFESIFSSRYPSADYTCQVRYGGVTENKCNPSQWNPTGTGEVEFILTHRSTGETQVKKFPILWDIISPGIPPSTTQNTTSRMVHIPTPPKAIISLQGKIDHTQVNSGSIFYCLSASCRVNLDGGDSLVTSGQRYSYLWTSSGRILSERKNPSEFEFSSGTHVVDFSITDEYGQSTHAQYRIIVGASEEEARLSDSEKQVLAASMEKPKKQKKSKVEIFSPPTLLLDNPGDTAYIMDGKYICRSPNKTCSLNFSLADTISDVEYHWHYSHEGMDNITDNPRSKSFSPGEYTLTLSAFRQDETEPIWTGRYMISVAQLKKSQSKKKVVKIVTPKKSTKKIETQDVGKEAIDLVPSAYADDNSGNRSIDTSMIFILFISIVLNIFLVQRKRI